MRSCEELIRSRIRQSCSVKEALLTDGSVAEIRKIAEALIDALRRRGKVLLFGNGGSAADAQHIAAELAGKLYLEREGLPAIALSVNTSALTAIGNDYSFDYIFARQVQALGREGDVAIGISTSGNSPNVIEGVRTAQASGMLTVGMTGETGGLLRKEVNHCICVPCKDTPRIQECHILVGHILCELVERELFGDAAGT